MYYPDWGRLVEEGGRERGGGMHKGTESRSFFPDGDGGASIQISYKKGPTHGRGVDGRQTGHSMGRRRRRRRRGRERGEREEKRTLLSNSVLPTLRFMGQSIQLRLCSAEVIFRQSKFWNFRGVWVTLPGSRLGGVGRGFIHR